VGSECFASFLLETRSSHEVDAQLKDFVLHSFQPCGIDCQKTVEPAEVCEGSSVTYTHAVSNIPNGAAMRNASIGIRLISQPGEQPQELLRHADAALYQAKRDGRDCYRFFAHSERAPTPTEIDLRDRITDCSVTLRYQPVIEVVAGHVANVEALARIRKPDGQMITPSEFIADSARAGLLDRLGELVLRRAQTDLCDLRNRVSDELTMSVNVSPCQLANTRFEAMVRDALAATALGPESLILEITDSASLTLGELARKVVAIQHGTPDEYDAILRELESLSDEEVERLLAEEESGAV